MNRKIAIPLLFSCFAFSGWAQEASTVKGQVLDSEGNPVIGATVVIKGTTNGIVVSRFTCCFYVNFCFNS